MRSTCVPSLPELLMEKLPLTMMAAIAFLICALLQATCPVAAQLVQPYIVYLGEHDHASVLEAEHTGVQLEAVVEKAAKSHCSLLAGVLGDEEKANAAIFYSYSRHINGFAANLDAAHAAEIARQPGVVSVFPSRAYKVHTTRSWEFLGLAGPGGAPSIEWQEAKFGDGTIIGNIDTESESFRDDGLGPIPSRWRGTCQKGTDNTFACNKYINLTGGCILRHRGATYIIGKRKLIGALYFNKGYLSLAGSTNSSENNSPRDGDGHGTHTLSTAGGSAVAGVSFFGNGIGTARGGSPGARVAAYRVGFNTTKNGTLMHDTDILAAFDAAIYDGVDVLSVSLGPGEDSPGPEEYFDDAIAIGSFHAALCGIAVLCSAGNSGPGPGTVSNAAPWIFTVAASTMDREFVSYVVFEKTKIKGQSLSAEGLPGKEAYPMVDSSEAPAPGKLQNDSQHCIVGSLDPIKVKGKIVVCLRGGNGRVEKGEAVKQAGGAAMVLANDAANGNDIVPDPHILPATHITFKDGQLLYSYLKSTKSPAGFITKPETTLQNKPAPVLANFSSQGPNTLNPEILKPDITGPGVNVIAAYTPAIPFSETDVAFDKRRVPFNMLSGTSMSCPHVAGIVGLIRTRRPDWSPAAIRSALITTATDMDNKGEPILNASFVPAGPFGYGAGHVSPLRAMDPGLVYDLKIDDYLAFLCMRGYNQSVMKTFNREAYSCPAELPKVQDLNYPSITVVNLTAAGATVRRTVKSVGGPGTYKASVSQPAGVHVTVIPEELAFSRRKEEKSFEVRLQVTDANLAKDYAFGSLVWTNGKNLVRSPLVVKTLA